MLLRLKILAILRHVKYLSTEPPRLSYAIPSTTAPLGTKPCTSPFFCFPLYINTLQNVHTFVARLTLQARKCHHAKPRRSSIQHHPCGVLSLRRHHRTTASFKRSFKIYLFTKYLENSVRAETSIVFLRSLMCDV